MAARGTVRNKKAALTAPGAVAASGAASIGHIVHYYDVPSAAVLEIESGGLRVGDTIQIRGHTTDFYQRVARLEIDHQSVEVAQTGDRVAVQLERRARQGDVVFRLD